MFTTKDLKTLAKKGITAQQAEAQLQRFCDGFPFLRIAASATAGKGVMRLDEKTSDYYLNMWNSYLELEHTIVKFVPASGAASRMFKELFAFCDAPYDVPTSPFEKQFFDGIEHFAFYKELNGVCQAKAGASIKELMKAGNYKRVAQLLLSAEGMNYGARPKGTLLFHYDNNEMRTPIEEHMAEGALYAKNVLNEVNLHFTISHEHQSLFKELVKSKQSQYEKEYGVHYNISFSEQKPSTDTLAVNPDNTPFRDEKGELLFRPGGHGALIENLNEINADVVFIKNIDNVVPDKLKETTVRYKKILGGVLVALQKQIHEYIRYIEAGQYDMAYLREVIHFLHDSLFVRNPETKQLEDSDLALYLLKKLKRPIRVCGMVINEGEPGGGPFLAYNADGTYSPQILESSQINPNDAEAQKLLHESTHFNPVDLVCALRDADGNPYDLTQFTDPDTGFISSKSKNGKPLKALELPGLWNGAMSDWNTLFVEVPAVTFNPVKTVNDLLRPQHQ